MSRGAVTDTSDADFARSMAVNVEAPFRISRAAIPIMAATGGGAIVNTASCWGLRPGPAHAVYCMTKAALASLTQCMGMDHARQRIRINAVCPNEVDTPMLRTGFERRALTPPPRSRRLAPPFPIGHVASPEEIADVVLFLASDDARVYVRRTGRGEWRETGIMRRFEGRVALVTGGRSGIGRAIAARLAEEGARVFTAQRSTDPNGDVEGIQAELTRDDAPANVVDDIARRAGRLDILVNNAGSMRQADIGALSLEDWQGELALNLTAPFLLIRSALPLLRRGPGAIVNIGSIEGMGANPGHAAYCASKAGFMV